MKLVKIVLTSFAFASVLSAKTITVAAASNLKFALDNLAQSFTSETGIEIKPVYGSSGKLTQQIMSGAPYDLFLSADMQYPAKLSLGGFTLTKPVVYAYGTLVLWSADETPLNEGIKGICTMKSATIALANPKTAPYGLEALNVMRFYNLHQSCRAKIVTAESIAQVGNYVTTRSVNAGFIAKSIVLSDEMKQIGKWVTIDSKSYTPIAQGMVLLKNNSNANQEAAKRFFEYLQSSKAKSVLKNNGYLLPHDGVKH